MSLTRTRSRRWDGPVRWLRSQTKRFSLLINFTFRICLFCESYYIVYYWMYWYFTRKRLKAWNFNVWAKGQRGKIRFLELCGEDMEADVAVSRYFLSSLSLPLPGFPSLLSASRFFCRTQCFWILLCTYLIPPSPDIHLVESSTITGTQTLKSSSMAAPTGSMFSSNARTFSGNRLVEVPSGSNTPGNFIYDFLLVFSGELLVAHLRHHLVS